MVERRVTYGNLMGILVGKGHLEDPDIDERIILKWIFKKWDGGIDWSDLAQERDMWQAFVNVVMNLRVP
jgi:hypothetical protein